MSLLMSCHDGLTLFVLQVAWYRVFGRNAAGSNVKARLSDYNLPGTGDEVNI